MKNYLIPILSIFITLLFFSCEKEINNENLNDIKWVLTEIKTYSEDKEPIKEVYIEFTDSTITGSGGCNHYWINYFSIKDNVIKLEGIASTYIYCGQEVSGFENLYYTILKSAERISLKGAKLTISCELGELKYKN